MTLRYLFRFSPHYRNAPVLAKQNNWFVHRIGLEGFKAHILNEYILFPFLLSLKYQHPTHIYLSSLLNLLNSSYWDYYYILLWLIFLCLVSTTLSQVLIEGEECFQFPAQIAAITYMLVFSVSDIEW